MAAAKKRAKAQPTNTGYQSVAASLGIQGRARSAIDGAIVLCYRDENDGRLVHIRASKVGENGVKPDTWYALDAEGEFIEIQNEEVTE